MRKGDGTLDSESVSGAETGRTEVARLDKGTIRIDPDLGNSVTGGFVGLGVELGIGRCADEGECDDDQVREFHGSFLGRVFAIPWCERHCPCGPFHEIFSVRSLRIRHRGASRPRAAKVLLPRDKD